MSESGALWGTLSKLLIPIRPRVHAQRFTDRLTKGIPDTNLCWKGIEAWVELKYGSDAELSSEQRLWLRTRRAAGGRAFVLWQLDKEYYLWSTGFGNWPKSSPCAVWRPRLTPEPLLEQLFTVPLAAVPISSSSG